MFSLQKITIRASVKVFQNRMQSDGHFSHPHTNDAIMDLYFDVQSQGLVRRIA